MVNGQAGERGESTIWLLREGGGEGIGIAPEKRLLKARSFGSRFFMRYLLFFFSSGLENLLSSSRAFSLFLSPSCSIAFSNVSLPPNASKVSLVPTAYTRPTCARAATRRAISRENRAVEKESLRADGGLSLTRGFRSRARSSSDPPDIQCAQPGVKLPALSASQDRRISIYQCIEHTSRAL